jgi:hypothetical protein
MRKEVLIRLFPVLSEIEIDALPNELVVCWYPSSGARSDLESPFCGYIALKHWQEQPAKLKPNFFIFSDVDYFEIPEEAEILFSQTFFYDPIIDYILKPIDMEKIPFDHAAKKKIEIFSKDMKQLYEKGFLQEKDYLIGREDDGMSLDSAIKKCTLEALIKEGCLEINSLIEEQKVQERWDIMDGYTEPIKTLTLHKYRDHFFLLIQAKNENVHERFIEQEITIPLLTINRPNDQHVELGYVSLEDLGVKELICGHSGTNRVKISSEFVKYPDFVFQKFTNPASEDIANLYSILK